MGLFKNLSRKNIICPYCFENFTDDKAMLLCENPHCASEKNEKLAKYNGVNIIESKHVFAQRRTFFGKKDEDGYKCNNCGIKSRTYVCPYCNNQIPENMLCKGSEIISIIGGPSSGKTTYIISLLQQLEEKATKIGLSIIIDDTGFGSKIEDERLEEIRSTASKYQKGKNDLFIEHNVVQTGKLKKHFQYPWIVCLKSLKTDKEIYLVFYDTAGEDFISSESWRDLRYIKKSKGVIVLLDTLSIPYIQNKINEFEDDNYKGEGTSNFIKTIDALSNFVINRNNRDLCKKPFSFVFSKIDVVNNHSKDLEFNTDSLKNDSSFKETGIFSLKEIDKTHEALKKYLISPKIFNSESVFAKLENLWGDNCRLFGVSSTGGPLNDIKEIAPFRVMDPLIWILHKLGGFEIPTDIKEK